MAKYKAPGFYTQEISNLPPSVAQVETAIPAFIGYTEKGNGEISQIGSMAEYTSIFGGAYKGEIGKFTVNNQGRITAPNISSKPTFKLFYMLEMFFANGGETCFIVSVGNYDTEANSLRNNVMERGLKELNKIDLPTLIVFADAFCPKSSEYPAELYKAALMQCARRKDRFLICDVEESQKETDTTSDSAIEFRDAIGINDLEFGAAYFPPLLTTLTYDYAEDEIKVSHQNEELVLRHSKESIVEDSAKTELSLYHRNDGKYEEVYHEIKGILDAIELELPPSAAVAGVYTAVDRTRGVWKAPANVSLSKVKAPKINITNKEQEDLNVTSSGKSINAIRNFTGKGVLIWGARTLAGNDNEWRYISVRRFFNMVEESVKKAVVPFTFEPNEKNTWVKVRALIENYLNTLWRDGALSGSKPEHGFYVRVGLGETMTAQDIVDGKMIIEIGMAVVRPAEFIVLKFSLKMAES